MHLILFVLRLLFGPDFLRSATKAQLAVRCDGRLQGTSEPEPLDRLLSAICETAASWLMFFTPRSRRDSAAQGRDVRSRTISRSRRR